MTAGVCECHRTPVGPQGSSRPFEKRQIGVKHVARPLTRPRWQLCSHKGDGTYGCLERHLVLIGLYSVGGYHWSLWFAAISSSDPTAVRLSVRAHPPLLASFWTWRVPLLCMVLSGASFLAIRCCLVVLRACRVRIAVWDVALLLQRIPRFELADNTRRSCGSLSHSSRTGISV